MTESFSRTAALSGPPPIPRSHRVATGWAVGLLAVIALVTLFLCEPHGQPFYPQCGLYVATGLACPGCGGCGPHISSCMGMYRQLLHSIPFSWC